MVCATTARARGAPPERARCPWCRLRHAALETATPPTPAGSVASACRPHRRRPLPAVEIVDLAAEKASAPAAASSALAHVRSAMREVLADGAQTILFLNRRGFSTRVLCFECGMPEHVRTATSLWCSTPCARAALPLLRPRCAPRRCRTAGPETALLGIGTERLEDEVRGSSRGAHRALDRDLAPAAATRSACSPTRARRLDVLSHADGGQGARLPRVRLVGGGRRRACTCRTSARPSAPSSCSRRSPVRRARHQPAAW